MDVVLNALIKAKVKGMFYHSLCGSFHNSLSRVKLLHGVKSLCVENSAKKKTLCFYGTGYSACLLE